MLRLETPSAIVVHCSASPWGTAAVIDEWHRAKGWEQIGYHWVVCNGWPTAARYRHGERDPEWDGKIQRGRSEDYAGAHVPELNRWSIGVCLIGQNGLFSALQIARAAALCAHLQERHPTISRVVGHCETKSGKEQRKTCPELDLDRFRELVLAARMFPTLELELDTLREAGGTS